MSNGASGNFYEGIMVTGETTDTTDAAVQANIVEVRYKNIPVPAPKAIGCYVDKSDAVGRDLPVCATKFLRTSNPLHECGQLCLAYEYFALENGHECRCGNTYGRWGKANATGCSMPCEQDPTEMCGGDYFESVYSV